MARSTTKQDILKAALDLFSVQGFEATSISQIAEAVGIRKASLYSHFENKQAILDVLVHDILEQYDEHSIFSTFDWSLTKEKMTAKQAMDMIQGQISYILHDEYISKGRKMLVIEQFQNPKLASLLTKLNYTDVLQYFTGFISYLIEQKVLVDDDKQMMAAHLCLPISVWINLCDREPERESEVMALVRCHIQQFFKLYQL